MHHDNDNDHVDHLPKQNEAARPEIDEGEYFIDETPPTPEEQLFLDLQQHLTMAEGDYKTIQRHEASSSTDPEQEIEAAMAQRNLEKRLDNIAEAAHSLKDRIVPEEQTRDWADRVKDGSGFDLNL